MAGGVGARGVTMAGSVTKFGLVKVLLALSWRPHSSHQVHLQQAQKASFLPAQHFGNPLHSLPTTASFSREPCVCVCVCITLIYILTWFKSTPLSAIIITHLLKGSTQFFLHLRRAAAGVAHRRPANTPPALPGIQTASAHTHSHCLPWCNGGFLIDSMWTESANTKAVDLLGCIAGPRSWLGR